MLLVPGSAAALYGFLRVHVVPWHSWRYVPLPEEQWPDRVRDMRLAAGDYFLVALVRRCRRCHATQVVAYEAGVAGWGDGIGGLVVPMDPPCRADHLFHDS